MGSSVGYVYVITREGDHRVKVGSSVHPPSRLASLQTGSPDRLRIAYTHRVAGLATGVELRVHEILDRHRGLGEWFAVPVEVAVAAISAAAYQVGEVEHHNDVPSARPNWLKRIGFVTLAFTPGWAALTAEVPILVLPMLFLGLTGLAAGILRSRGRYGIGPAEAARWCGAIIVGLGTSILCGVIIGSAHAQTGAPMPAFDPVTYCRGISTLTGGGSSAQNNCIAAETEARQHIAAIWSSTPADIRVRCATQAGIAGAMSNYQALGGCLAFGVGNRWLNGEIGLSR